MTHMKFAVRCADRRLQPDEYGRVFMSKRYQLVRELFPLANGNFIEAFRLALVEFTSLGMQKFDIAGYPYDTEAQGLGADWNAIARDCQISAVRVVNEYGQAVTTSGAVEPSE